MISFDGNYKIHTFLASDTFSVLRGGEVQYLIVGGGGSGGGGGSRSTYSAGGGSGIVIIAYQGTAAKATGGTISTSSRAGYVVHTFTSSGTFTVL